MAETEGVAQFKEFARAELLAALREAGGDELQKERTYLQIREAFSRKHGWPEELDEIEPGRARMPRWRNRLHWVVAEFVRRGLLEPSEDQKLIRPTPLGRAILRLPAPFRDTPETRTLIEALQSAVPDERQNGEARQALADFWKRFPSERLAGLSLDEYASGSLRPEHFCWWLESGLGTAGSYSLGSPRNRLIYRDSSGEVLCIRSLRNMPAEEAMKRVASWHAEVVAFGEQLETKEDNDRAMNLLGQSRTLKLLHSYFPDRFLPINSMDHMAQFLRAFGVSEETMPDLAVGRNRLLFRLYECLGQPRGLEPYDFRRILYDRFNPRPVAIDETRLRGAIRLFTWYYGGDCTSDRFMHEERNYKMEIAERWQNAADVDDLATALEEGTVVEKARDLAKALLDRPSNFLNYRYQELLRGLNDPADARLFLEAVLDLLGSAGSDEGVPDVSRFNERMLPLYERLDPSARVAASRSIPTLMLMLSYPDRDIFVRSDVLHRARPALTGKKHAFEDEGMLTTTSYLEIRTFAGAIRDKIAELAPRDMIDVQGFLWSTLSQRGLWFGGISYRSDTGRTEDMLESFRARGVYAVGYGRDPLIQALIADQVRLKGEERKKAASRLEAAASSSKEAKALNAFVELAARPGELVIAKSTYFPEQSILRIRGVACVGGEVGFDPDLGHTVSVTWSDPVDVRLSNKSFNKLAGTLVALPLGEALDVLGSDEVSVSERKREEAIQPRVQPDLPKNLILYGPPGTGKTWRVLEKIGPSFADRVELVTFHPNFAYEEFVEGLRPLTDEGTSHVRYDVVPGVFKRLCQKALDHPELPFLLIIDEINRANLAAVLGELITLVEEDKRDKGRVMLPYSKEPFTVPGNLWIVGTMNTADRSIALMDVALRRRFVFEEVEVSYTALTEDFAACNDPAIRNLDLAGVLQIMNDRLRILVDREHQIGHAWLFGVRSLDDLKERFSRRILPLLSEYFYDDWSRVCLVLGEDPEKTATTDLIRKTVVSPNRQKKLIGRTVRDGAPLVLFDPGDPSEWTADHFAKILPATADDEVDVLEAAAE